MNNVKALMQYIKNNFVHVDRGGFAGMSEEPTIEQLMTLKNYLENAIHQKVKQK